MIACRANINKKGACFMSELVRRKAFKLEHVTKGGRHGSHHECESARNDCQRNTGLSRTSRQGTKHEGAIGVAS